jgi:putative FmdB family regulatory protein
VPIYEYRCATCGRRFEKIQKLSDKPKAKCPDCGGEGQRLLSAPAIRFKGTGWYVTDYARKGRGGDKEEGGDKPAAADKPAAKDEAGGKPLPKPRKKG